MREHVLSSSLLAAAGAHHAFFTRRGGVSAPPCDSLDFGSRARVDGTFEQNLTRAAALLGVDVARVCMPKQMHGARVVELGPGDDRGTVQSEEADALVAARAGLACAVRTADCVPVLFYDRSSGAAAAVHSGWKGTAMNIVAAAVRALERAAGPAPHLVAAIGPHIEVCCFEVGEDVAEALARASSAPLAIERIRARPHACLRAIVRAQLEAAGMAPEHIDDVRGCTVCDAARFFSYRRDRDRSGRLLSAVVSGRRGDVSRAPDASPLGASR